MLIRLTSLVCLLSTMIQGLDTGSRETVLLLNNKPLDLEWENCRNARSCIQTNVIDRVADLETKIQNVTFGDVPEEKGLSIDLGLKLKMKMIHKEDGKLAVRLVANSNPLENARGHIAEKYKAILIGFSMLLFVLGVISTTLKVNVFLALLGVAVGKILLFWVYSEHLHAKYHGHHHHGPAGLHIHKAPTYYHKHEPVQIIEQPELLEVHHDHHDFHHDHHDYHHDHHDFHHDHHDYHDHHHGDWDIIRKKKSLEIEQKKFSSPE
uniref:Uncharacterized protein n=1 Tax=Cacopsylla melanoneura TaxID=428564 RepID=A0A8D8XIV2_9HEMI